MRADDQIVDALEGKWSSFPFEMLVASDGGNRISPLTAEQVAEVIEPIIKAREAATLKEFRRLAVRSYPKGLTSTGIMIADINERIRRLEDENSEGN